MPEHVFLFARQLIVRSENREVIFGCTPAELLLPHLHFLSMPALYAAVIDAQGGIWNHQFFVNSDDAPESFAGRACSDGRIEREHVVVRLFKRDAVSLKTGREVVGYIGWKECKAANAVAFVQGCFERIGQTGHRVGAVVNRHAVNDEVQIVGIDFVKQRSIAKHIADAHNLSFTAQTDESLLHFHFQMLLEWPAFGYLERRHDDKLGAWRERKYPFQYVFRRVFLHFFAADRGVGVSDAGV